jgi:hypothetical protein
MQAAQGLDADQLERLPLSPHAQGQDALEPHVSLTETEQQCQYALHNHHDTFIASTQDM